MARSAALVLVAVIITGVACDSEAMERFPKSRSGRELIGKPLDLDDLRWVEPSPEGVELEGSVTLVRWFTDGCPFCIRSLPAIMELKATFGRSSEFQTVAVYHPKPPRKVSDSQVRQAARELGYSGPLAIDPRWETLRKTYLDRHSKGATSVSFLLDREGRVRYVHPGPEFHPPEKGDDVGASARDQIAPEVRDYEEIRAAIEILLAEGSTSRGGKEDMP